MAQGLQIFNGNGFLMLDITDRLPKFLGTANISSSASSGTVYNSEIGDGDLWWFIVSSSYPDKETTLGAETEYHYPTITKGNGCFTWQFPPGKNLSCTIIYGIY